MRDMISKTTCNLNQIQLFLKNTKAWIAANFERASTAYKELLTHTCGQSHMCVCKETNTKL